MDQVPAPDRRQELAAAQRGRVAPCVIDVSALEGQVVVLAVGLAAVRGEVLVLDLREQLEAAIALPPDEQAQVVQVGPGRPVAWVVITSGCVSSEREPGA